MTKLKQWFNGLPNQIRAGVTTAFFAFWTVFLTTVFGWVASLINALQTGTPIPGISAATAAIVSAFLAFLAAVLNTLYRWVQSKGWLGFNPKIVPVYGVNDPATPTGLPPGTPVNADLTWTGYTTIGATGGNSTSYDTTTTTGTYTTAAPSNLTWDPGVNENPVQYGDTDPPPTS